MSIELLFSSVFERVTFHVSDNRDGIAFEALHFAPFVWSKFAKMNGIARPADFEIYLFVVHRDERNL